MRFNAAKTSASGAVISFPPSWPSCLQPGIGRIIERAVLPQGRRLLAEGLDGEVALGHQLHRQIAIDDGLADAMAEIGAAGDRDHAAFMEARLAAEDGERPLDGEGGEPPARALRLDLLQRRAADELSLAQRDPGAEAGLVGVVVGRDVRAPIEIALLHPER